METLTDFATNKNVVFRSKIVYHTEAQFHEGFY